MNYFGACDIDGAPSGSTPANNDPGYTFWRAYTCPGTGNQTVGELSAMMNDAAQSGINIRLAIYNAGATTLIAQGDSIELATSSTDSWQGGSISAVTLVGGTDYVLAITIENNGTGAHSDHVDYSRSYGSYKAGDLNSGFPSALSSPDGSYYMYPIRCGVSPASGVSLTASGTGASSTAAAVGQVAYGLTASGTGASATAAADLATSGQVNLTASATGASATAAAVLSRLLLHWKLDEGSGSSAADAAGMGNTGTISGGPVWTSGPRNTCLEFDGVNDSLSVSSVTGLPTGNAPHTLAAWIKVTALPADRAWIALLGDATTGAHHWLLQANGNSAFGVWSGNQVYPSLTVGTWQHVAITFDGTTLTGYLDGTSFGSTAATFNLAGVPLTLALVHNGENYFNGALDDVRVYDRALTVDEIALLLPLEGYHGVAAGVSATADAALGIACYLTAQSVFDVAFEDGDVAWVDGDVSFTPHEHPATLGISVALAAAGAGVSSTASAVLSVGSATTVDLTAAASGASVTAAAVIEISLETWSDTFSSGSGYIEGRQDWSIHTYYLSGYLADGIVSVANGRLDYNGPISPDIYNLLLLKPSSSDYFVSMSSWKESVVYSQILQFGIARASSSVDNKLTAYCFYYYLDTHRLARIVDGEWSQIANNSGAIDVTQPHTWTIEVSGSDPVRIRCFCDGVAVIDYNDSSGSRITVTGYAGIIPYLNSATTAHIDDFYFHTGSFTVVPLSAAAAGASATASAVLWQWPTVGPISAAAGDGGWMFYDDGWDISTNPNPFMGNVSGEPEWGFMRFELPASVGAAKRAIAAGVDMKLIEEYGFVDGQKFLRIYATNSADAPLPTAVSQRPAVSGGSTALTTASVRWPAAGDFVSPRTPGDWFETPDISALLNELIVNHGGLASGAGVTLWFATV